MPLPVLDPKPSTVRPADWSFNKILMAKKEPTLPVYPPQYKNPFVSLTAPRDQDARGTCVGQSSATLADILHIKNCPDDKPTTDDVSQYKKDVVDVLGTRHDILYPQSISAECLYQMSRKIGNITYPSGSEIRFAAKAGISYGMNTENQWHTDKSGTKVWKEADGFPIATPDGGISQQDAALFAKDHVWEGWALIGDGMNLYWEEICYAISLQGCVLGGIPIYENYSYMQGGDGTFPDPKGNIVGYHALVFYGYDGDFLYLIHSWGSWCGRLGKISRNYFNISKDQSVYITILDSADVAIARTIYTSLTVNVISAATKVQLPADVYVNAVKIGIAPVKFATEKGKMYAIDVQCEGYLSQGRAADDSVKEITFELDAKPEPKSWWMRFIDWLFGKLRR